MLGKLTRPFLKGFVGLLPISLSIYLIFWLIEKLEVISRALIDSFIPYAESIPGLSLIIIVAFIYLFGLLLSSSFFSHLFRLVQLPFKNIPLVKSIYSAVEDLMFYFGQSGGEGKGKVVKVYLKSLDIELIGLMTQEDLTKIDSKELSKDRVAVFIPLSYALGGYTLFVKKEDVTILSMRVEKAMKLAITAWMLKGTEQKK
jgi:uncharacterized membrane protein